MRSGTCGYEAPEEKFGGSKKTAIWKFRTDKQLGKDAIDIGGFCGKPKDIFQWACTMIRLFEPAVAEKLTEER